MDISEQPNRPKVAIIGSGFSGLNAIRHLSKVADVTCFEMKEAIGGLWRYSEETSKHNSWDLTPENDLFTAKNGSHFDSMYDNLQLFAPWWFMQFKGLAFP